MSNPTDSERVPSLDDILARLAALAPLDTPGSTAAPVPEAPPMRRGPLLELEGIVAETEALVAAPVTTIESESQQPVIDLRDRVDADAPVDPAPARTPETTAPVLEPGSIVEPAVANAVAEAVLAEAELDDVVVEPEVDEVAVEPELDLRPVEPVDISRHEPASVSATPAPSGQPRRSTRAHNPFKRLIIWSVLLGLGLLVGAAIMLVT